MSWGVEREGLVDDKRPGIMSIQGIKKFNSSCKALNIHCCMYVQLKCY